jgi:predicted Zn-dependent protease
MQKWQSQLKQMHHLFRRCGAGVVLFWPGLLLVVLLSRSSIAQALPGFRTYPLPPSLAHLAAGDDYVDQINPTPVGSLLWSEFPITVAIDLADSRAPREGIWLQAVRQAITDWNQYLPVVETTDRATANIIFRRATVPIRRDQAGKLQRIRMAETRFAFFADRANRLQHRMTIHLSPNQANAALLAAARHELGHALGIWGHSDRVDDVMYFAQVRQPVQISDRDARTLKQVYQMPTRLGGELIDP